MTTRQPQTIKRMIAQIDECLPTPLFHEMSKSQAKVTPIEIEKEGTRYRFTDCYMVPALNGTMLYTIGVYTEVMGGSEND
jgi:hypothetical protein